MTGTRRRAGFSLLELMAAFAIFLMIAAVAMEITDGAADMAISARASRELRYLAEYRLEEIKVFEEEYDDLLEGDFGDVDDELYGEFEWTLDIRDVTVFGVNRDEDAQYYWDAPSEEDQDTPTQTQQQGTRQELREITLTVTAPEVGGHKDSVTIVTLMPTVQYSQ